MNVQNSVDVPARLRDLVREAVDSGLSDPVSVAARVAELAEEGELRDLLGFACRDRVRALWSSARTTALSRVVSGECVPRQGSGLSAKVEQRRGWFQRFLESPFHIDGSWRRAGECCADDWDVAAAERRLSASRSLAEAERLEKLAALMRERGVSRTDELSAEDVRDALGGVLE